MWLVFYNANQEWTTKFQLPLARDSSNKWVWVLLVLQACVEALCCCDCRCLFRWLLNFLFWSSFRNTLTGSFRWSNESFCHVLSRNFVIDQHLYISTCKRNETNENEFFFQSKVRGEQRRRTVKFVISLLSPPLPLSFSWRSSFPLPLSLSFSSYPAVSFSSFAFSLKPFSLQFCNKGSLQWYELTKWQWHAWRVVRSSTNRS